MLERRKTTPRRKGRRALKSANRRRDCRGHFDAGARAAVAQRQRGFGRARFPDLTARHLRAAIAAGHRLRFWNLRTSRASRSDWSQQQRHQHGYNHTAFRKHRWIEYNRGLAKGKPNFDDARDHALGWGRKRRTEASSADGKIARRWRRRTYAAVRFAYSCSLLRVRRAGQTVGLGCRFFREVFRAHVPERRRQLPHFSKHAPIARHFRDCNTRVRALPCAALRETAFGEPEVQKVGRYCNSAQMPTLPDGSNSAATRGC
jgi:hypothetical protein